MLDFDCKFVESLMGLMEIFDVSSFIGFDVNERGIIELPEFTSLEGDPGSGVTPIGDKFVD